MPQLTIRDVNQILAALRYWQRDMDMDGFESDMNEAEIEQLCQKLDAGEYPDA